MNGTGIRCVTDATRLTDVLKRENEAAEKCHICLKNLMIQGIDKLGITAFALAYIEGQPKIIET